MRRFVPSLDCSSIGVCGLNYYFHDCILNFECRELRRGETLVSIEPQAFDLLLYLIRNRARVVSKDELISSVWGGRIVSDSALTTRINAARTAIGDSGKIQSMIRTFPRKGFRFVGDVSEHVAELGVAAGKSPVVVRAEARASCVLMGEDEGTVLGALRRGREAVTARLTQAGATLHPTPAHTVVASFNNTVQGVLAAAAARDALAGMNRTLPAESRVHYRFGIAHGDVGEGSDGPGGAAVEQAAALGVAAHPDAIRMSGPVQALLPANFGFATARAGTGEYELEGVVQPGSAAGLPAQLQGADLPLPGRPSIVLLPFKAVGDEREQSEALAEGLRLDIQNALIKMSGVFLLAAGTANAMRGWSGTEAATRAGVRYALEGTVQQSAGEVRVNVQLTDAVGGTVPWSEQYSRALDRNFALQDEIAERIVTALDIKLASGEQARIWHKCLVDPQARECFCRGVQAFIRMNRESIASARVFFERVAQLAPDSPYGPTWIALCLWFESARGWADPVEARELAGVWAERAVAMDDADGQAHTVLGNVRLLQQRFDEALAVAREALEIRPGCANANGFLANVLLYCGEPQQAILHARRAIRFMPIYPPWFVEILAAAYRDAGVPDLGAIAAREVLRIVPAATEARLVLASALVRSGWLADARRVAGEANELDAKLTLERWAPSQPYRDRDTLAAVMDDLFRAGIPTTA
jgi:DNA-binding winged helix-turn-helix (wHTH) protein/TolB-like protein